MLQSSARSPVVTSSNFGGSTAAASASGSTLQIPPLRRARSLGSADFSRGVYRVGGNNNSQSAANFPYGQAGEFLQALPMIKVDTAFLQLGGDPATGAQALLTPIYRMQTNSTTVTPAYDNLNGPGSIFAVGSQMETYLNFMSRIGVRFPALRIDASLAAPNTAQSPRDVYLLNAITFCLRSLDTALGHGTGTAPNGQAQQMRGLAVMAGSSSIGYSRATTSTAANLQGNLIKAVTTITVSGSGAGEGANCLVGGPIALRALVGTAAGSSAASGWKEDARTGLMVYHWLGLPYYRTDVDETSGGRMYAANLGPSGLALAFGCGTAETYGFQVDEMPITETSGNKEYTVHGAFSLVAFEPEAIFELNTIV